MSRAKGSGSIHQRADGNWVGSFERARDPQTGRRRRATIVRKDRAQVAAVMDDLGEQRDIPRAKRIGTLKRTPESIRTAVRASLDVAFDPNGYFVYLLWGEDLEQPLYIGRSTNVLSRLGTHLNDRDKRAVISRVSMMRCDSEMVMCKMEERLIRLYEPEWNTAGCSLDHRANARAHRKGALTVEDIRVGLEKAEIQRLGATGRRLAATRASTSE